MQNTLPRTKYSVTLYDFIPEDVFEKYQEMIAKNIRFDMKDANVTIDRIAEELGADRAHKIQTADDGERAVLMDEARKEIIAKNVRAEINLAETHEAERERCIGMIIEMKNKDEVLDVRDTLGKLPRGDYAKIKDAIKEIDADDEEDAKKSAGQSDA